MTPRPNLTRTGRRTLAAAVVVGMSFPLSITVAAADTESEEIDAVEESPTEEAETEETEEPEREDSTEDSDEEAPQQDETEDQEPEPENTTVTPDSPWEDGDNQVGIPEQEGVAYTVNGDTVTGTIEVPEGGLTVSAVAQSGYEISGQSDFDFHHITPEPEISTVTPEAPSFDESTGEVTIPDQPEGVITEPGPGTHTVAPGEVLTVTATAAEGYQIDGQGEWHFETPPDEDEEDFDPTIWSEGEIVRGSDFNPEETYTLTVTGSVAEVGSTTLTVNTDGTTAPVDVTTLGFAGPGTHIAAVTDSAGNEVAATEVYVDIGGGWFDPDVAVEGTTVTITGADPEETYTISKNGSSAEIPVDEDGNGSVDAAEVLNLEPREEPYALFITDSEDFTSTVEVTVEPEDEEYNPQLTVEDTWLSLSEAHPEAEYTVYIADDQHTFSTDADGEAGFDITEHFDLDPGEYEVTVTGPDDYTDTDTVIIEESDPEYTPEVTAEESTITVTGAEPGEDYTFTTDGLLTGQSHTATADEDGVVSIDANEVFDLRPGERTVTVTGPHLDRTEVTVTIEEPDPEYTPEVTPEDTTVTLTGGEPGEDYTFATGGRFSGESTTVTADEDGTAAFDVADWDLEPGEHEVRVTGAHLDRPTTVTITIEDEDDDEDLETVTPEAPTQEGDTITIPNVDGVTYERDGNEVTDDITIEPGQTLTIDANPDEGYEFDEDAETQWEFSYDFEDVTTEVDGTTVTFSSLYPGVEYTVTLRAPILGNERGSVSFTADESGTYSIDAASLDPHIFGGNHTISITAEGDYPGAETQVWIDALITEITPEAPGHDAESNTIVIPDQSGVSYTVGGNTVTGTVDVPEGGLTVEAHAEDGHVFPEGTTSSWTYEHTPAEDPDPVLETVEPAAPYLSERNQVTVIATEGVTYSHTGTVTVPEGGLTITATPAEDYEFDGPSIREWSFTYTPPTTDPDPRPDPDPTPDPTPPPTTDPSPGDEEDPEEDPDGRPEDEEDDETEGDGGLEASEPSEPAETPPSDPGDSEIPTASGDSDRDLETPPSSEDDDGLPTASGDGPDDLTFDPGPTTEEPPSGLEAGPQPNEAIEAPEGNDDDELESQPNEPLETPETDDEESPSADATQTQDSSEEPSEAPEVQAADAERTSSIWAPLAWIVGLLALVGAAVMILLGRGKSSS